MSPISYPLRGQVHEADVGFGPKLWLVVSNNSRNRNLSEVIVVRLTSTAKGPRSTIVELDKEDAPLYGRILCDDLGPLYKDEIGPPQSSISAGTMRRVDEALASALGIDLDRIARERNP